MRAVLYAKGSSASIPNLHRFAPGFYTGIIELRDMSLPANITRYYVQLNIVPAPTWILDPNTS